jgi:hypothetical protein
VLIGVYPDCQFAFLNHHPQKYRLKQLHFANIGTDACKQILVVSFKMTLFGIPFRNARRNIVSGPIETTARIDLN